MPLCRSCGRALTFGDRICPYCGGENPAYQPLSDPAREPALGRSSREYEDDVALAVRYVSHGRSLRHVLHRYVGRDDVGVNISGADPRAFVPCTLEKLAADHMVFRYKGLVYRINYGWVIRVVESMGEPITRLTPAGEVTFPVCIESYHLVVYRHQVDVPVI